MSIEKIKGLTIETVDNDAQNSLKGGIVITDLTEM